MDVTDAGTRDDRPPCRESTAAARRGAVERVVAALRERLGEPLSLDEMARIAISSPFHFNRVFREVTGVPPGRFLSALRLQQAKRLLATTQRSVTDICFGVGYNSLGTFTSHFTEFVGTSPNRLRRLVRQAALEELLRGARGRAAAQSSGTVVAGRIEAAAECAGPAAVGLFRMPIPRGHPGACALVEAPGRFALDDVPDGRYYLFAAGVSCGADMVACLLGESSPRGRAGPIVVRGGRVAGVTDIVLRPPRLTDPPILVALPVLMMARHGLSSRAVATSQSSRE